MAQRSKDGAETILRKCGINESYQLAMYLLDQYRGTTLSCRYAIPPHLAPAESRTQLEEAVKVAVVDTIMRHPMLQVGMVDATSKTPSWIQLRSLDLTQHIKWVHIGGHDDFEHTVQEAFRTQLDGRFPEFSIKQPGWTMIIYRQESSPIMEALLTWNHPQFDGAGAKVLHEDFLEFLNAGSVHDRAGLDGDILTLPQARPLLPVPIERLQKLPVDLTYLAKVFWEDIRPQFMNRDPAQATWSPIRSSPYKTQFRAFSIDQASLVAVLALCRQNKTTITGLLHGLALIAFSSRLDSATAPAFQGCTIIDHRRNLPPAPPDVPWAQSDRAVANYVTQMPHRYDTELVARIRSKLPAEKGEGVAMSADLQRELWDVSVRSRQEITARLEARLRNDIVGVFKYVTDWQKTMKDQAKKTRQLSWLVTNIGVLEGGPNDTGQEWSIDWAQFGLSAEIPAAAIEFSPVSVAGRGMCVAASWPDCAVDIALGEGIMADLERWLGQLASQ
ncbi:alcohol acetyltransferase-domain-containing protein [Apiospora kogelbergensis]|uniref:alcohol acetyltransferase-domain-containing protein n=1 Tax=Apiospora kogelbergensis TaxID=1337665 RepID=UPI003131F8F7